MNLISKWKEEIKKEDKEWYPLTSTKAGFYSDRLKELTEAVQELERLIDGIKLERDFMGEFGAYLSFEIKAPKEVRDKFSILDKTMWFQIKHLKEQAKQYIKQTLGGGE